MLPLKVRELPSPLMDRPLARLLRRRMGVLNRFLNIRVLRPRPFGEELALAALLPYAK